MKNKLSAKTSLNLEQNLKLTTLKNIQFHSDYLIYLKNAKDTLDIIKTIIRFNKLPSNKMLYASRIENRTTTVTTYS